MANNFRKVGDAYVSKAGSDGNSGAVNTPRATISAGISALGSNSILIVGTGTYEETIATGNHVSLTADGATVLKGNGSNSLSTGASTLLSGFTIREYLNCFFGSTGYGGEAINCVFVNTNIVLNNTSGGAANFTNCQFVNCTIDATSLNYGNFTNCIFINVDVTGFIGTGFTNCYVNGASTIRLATGSTSDYNNMMGTIYMSDNVGTPRTFSDYRTNYTTRDTHSFNLNPLFNNAAKMDFSLQASSPHINAGTGGSTIGGTMFAKSTNVYTSAEWQVGSGSLASFTNLVLSGQDIVVATGQNNGIAVSDAILVASNPMAIQRIDYLGLLLFNKSQTGGTATNKQVPDCTVYAGSDASGGGNPDRLIIEIRTCTSTTKPAVDADFDNNHYAAAGAWIKVPINEQPQIDNFQKGNGEIDFDFTSYQPIVACWVQVRLTLTNIYV